MTTSDLQKMRDEAFKRNRVIENAKAYQKKPVYPTRKEQRRLKETLEMLNNEPIDFKMF